MGVEQLTKRDGRVVPFERQRIEQAIYAAARAVGNGGGRQWAETMTWAVIGILEERFGQNGHIPHVEEVQDVVEEVLIKSGHPQVAKAYILYRQKRAEARATERMLMDTEKLVDDYLQKLDWRVNENSNMNYSLQGLNFYLASSIAARYWLHKIYPREVQQAHSEGEMHLHDLGMLSGYTYYGKEVVVFKDEEGVRLTSFEQSYASCPEPEVCLDEADGAFAKYPRSCFVLDRDGWTRVVRLVRKSKNRPMRFVKNRGGRSIIVTDNHPMITRDGENLAANVSPRTDALYTVDLHRLLSGEGLFSETEIDMLVELQKAGVTQFGRDRVYFNGVPITDLDVDQAGAGVIHTHTRTIPRRVPLTAEFGYFVGFVLAEGYLSYDTDAPRTISITQKDARALHEINRALISLGIPGCISHRDGADLCELQIKNVFLRFLFEHVFGIQPGARHKSLPVRTLHYNLDFVKGMLAGIMDGDGSIDGQGTGITIRVSARTLLEQMACVLHLLGATPRDRNIEGVGSSRSFKGREIVQRFPLYGLSFRKTAELTYPSSKFQAVAVSSRAWQDETRDEWHIVLNNEPTDIPDDDIYDITTESGTLIVNGMWNHNCCGWDLQDLLLQGFGGVPAKIESRPPKHLRTALGQLVNFFYTLQGEVAGAVAVSNFDTLLAPFIRYDGLDYTGIKQAVQEFVFNINVPTRVGFQSLVWDELVLVRRNGRIEPVEIGQLVDEQFTRNGHRILGQGNGSYAVANADNVQALAFDGDGMVRWIPVKAFVRHQVPQGSTFVRMRTSRGTAAVSQAHSMFAFEELNGRCTARPIAAHQVDVAHGNANLTPTNHLVAVRRAPNGGTCARLDLAELIDAVPQLAGRVRVRLAGHAAAVERLKQRAQQRFGGLTAFYLEYGIKDKGCWRQWTDNQSLPYRVWRGLGEDEANADFALRNSKLWYARTLDGDRLAEFVRLLGWYIAEGHNDITNGLYVSQARGADQEEMERVLRALGALGRVEETSGWSAQGNPTSAVLRMAGKGLLAALIGFAGGTYSTNKVIPWFVYELTRELQEEFIATLLRGDGSEFPGHHDYTTTSKKLSLGFSLLLAMNGYKFGVYENSYERETWSDQYVLRIYKDKSAGEGYAVGDLLGRVCNRREPFGYDREYEYDLSVDTPLENFAGGSGLLCFHNTPFTNITMDLTAPSTLRDQAVIIAGELRDATYGEFQEEMDLLNRAFAEVMLEGDAKRRVMTFPIPTYNVTRDFDWHNPVLEPVWLMTAKYGSPYFCLEEDTAVLLSDHTPIPVKNVHACDFLVGPDGSSVLVTAVYRRKVPELVQVTLKSGQVISATPTHRFPTNGGLKETRTLSLDDRLVRSVPGTIHLGATNATMNAQELEELFDLYTITESLEAVPVRPADLSAGQPVVIRPKPFPQMAPRFTFEHKPDDHDTNSQILTLPERMTPEIGRLLGYLVGDGYYAKSNSTVTFVSMDEAMLRDYAAIVEELGLNYRLGQAGKSKVAKEIALHSVAFRQLLLQIGLHRVTASHKTVPHIIYQCPEELVAQFLRGLFDTDGSVALRPLITYTSASETLVRQVQVLLLRMGIASHFSKTPLTCKLTITGENIRRFAKKIGSVHEKKCARLEQHSRSSGRKALGEPLLSTRQQVAQLVALGRLPPHYRYSKSYQGYFRIPAGALRHLLPGDTPVLGDYIMTSMAAATEYEPIAKLRLVKGSFAVVDVSVDSKEHLFTLYGGILSHNSNYINSDMNPEDARSMCPLHPDMLVPVNVDGVISVCPIREVFDRCRDKHPRVLFNDQWYEAVPVATPTKGCLELSVASGVQTTMDVRHEQLVKDGPGRPSQLVTAAGVRPGMYLPFSSPQADNGNGGYHEDGFWWFPVEAIRDVAYDGQVYCFAVDSEDHLFQLANGLVTHNCRLRLDNRELRKRMGGLFAAAPLTGSAGVATINLPRIAYQSRDETEFQRRLERLMEIARTSLEIKRKMLEQLTERGLYPYSRHYLSGVKEQTGGYWNHHFSTIGLIGMNEACLNLLGVGIADPEGKALAVRTLTFMRDVLARFQEESDSLFNLEATPAEGASYRLARADKKRFPDIQTAGTSATPFYTNSSHLPVGYSDDLFAVLDHQDELQTLYTGGTVLHIFLGEQLHDWRQARKLVRTVAENYRLPYYTITPTFSICPVHGYIAGEHKYCPYEHTAEEMARFGRVVQE